MPWTAHLIRVVRELSDRGLSDTAIAVVLELYEGLEGVGRQGVQGVRYRNGITKPVSAIHALHPVKGPGNCGEALRLDGL